MVGLNGFCAMKKITYYYRLLLLIITTEISCVFPIRTFLAGRVYYDNHLTTNVKILCLHSALF